MIHETLDFSDWFPNTCSKCFLKLMEAAEKKKKKNPARVVWCLCWMGEFSVQAEQTFRPPVQSVRLLYCYQLLSLRHIHSPFASRLFSESTKDMILQVFQQNNHQTATCHSNVPGGYFTVGAGSIVRERMGGELSNITPRLRASTYSCCLRAKILILITNWLSVASVGPNPVQTTCCSHQLWGRWALRNRRQMTPHWPADIQCNSYKKFFFKWICCSINFF